MWQARLLFVLIWASIIADAQEHAMLTAEDLGQPQPVARETDSKTTELKRSLNMGPGGYHVIRNFMVSHRSHKAEVKSRVGCANVCNQHKNCRSFSYRAGDKRCLWSEEALHYDSKFVFSMKVTKMNDMGQMKATGQYKHFDNLAYKEKGWRKIVAGRAGCKDLCNKMDKCGAFSFREFDNLCLLADDSVKYDTDFNYYERNPARKKKSAKTMIKVLSKQPMQTKKAQKKSIKKTNKVLKKQMKKGVKTLKSIAKTVARAKGAESRAAAKEETMRNQMLKDIKERGEKSKQGLAITKMRAQATKVVHIGRRSSKEAKRKATSKIKNAFQEGYMKAQEKNGSSYRAEMKEIAEKAKESLKKHTDKIRREARQKEKAAKEKEKKERVAKEIKQKEKKKEAKQKAQNKVQVQSLLKYNKDGLLADRERIKNLDVFKAKLKISEKRRKRSRALVQKKLDLAILKEKQRKQEVKNKAKERKDKIHHEARVKEEQKKDIEYARKKKEQSLKEIDKKAEIFSRNKKAKELQQKLDAAKRAAQETQAKHKERATKIGKCKERRVKGQFVTYAYAREATFTNAANAGTKYGAAAAYNGMMRIQNGLGNKKQNAYLKFSAKGNKIVDESIEFTTDLGEGRHSVLAVAKAKELITKGKVQYVARRRWVDRRRRWSVEKVSAARRRSILASRRRAVVERRRRSLPALESAVTQATLKVFKFGGPASKLTVKATSCDWKRPTISYGNAGKLSIPVERKEDLILEHLREFTLSEVQTEETANLGNEDSNQQGYWSGRRHGLLGELKMPSKVGGEFVRRRRQPVPRPPPPPIPLPKPYVPSRRRYVDRRRRFPAPKTVPKKVPTQTAPGPTARRRRFIGKTAGSAFVPATNNVWVSIKLSPNIVGVMRSKDKMCMEIVGGGPAQPVILGSEKSTNKPKLVVNVKGQGGARRRRCSAVVALQGLSKIPATSKSTGNPAKKAKSKPKKKRL